jgi:hypothetical protein
MITITIIFLLLYVRSFYQIRKECTGDKYLEPSEINIYTYIIFVSGTIILSFSIIIIVIYLAIKGILP